MSMKISTEDTLQISRPGHLSELDPGERRAWPTTHGADLRVTYNCITTQRARRTASGQNTPLGGRGGSPGRATHSMVFLCARKTDRSMAHSARNREQYEHSRRSDELHVMLRQVVRRVVDARNLQAWRPPAGWQVDGRAARGAKVEQVRIVALGAMVKPVRNDAAAVACGSTAGQRILGLVLLLGVSRMLSAADQGLHHTARVWVLPRRRLFDPAAPGRKGRGTHGVLCGESPAWPVACLVLVISNLPEQRFHCAAALVLVSVGTLGCALAMPDLVAYVHASAVYVAPI